MESCSVRESKIIIDIICLEKISFLCHKIKESFHYFGLLLFKNAILHHQIHD